MNFEELFRDFWWLLFPIFGMAMGVSGMVSSDRRSREVMTLIKSYLDQGKEVPPELLRMASSDWDQQNPPSRQQSNGWNFFMFAALAAGFTTGWWFVRAESWSFAFLIVAVTMGVLAVGALFLAITSRRS